MQDSLLRSGRLVVANAQDGVATTDKRGQELTRIFHALFESSCTVTVQASAGDFSGIRDHCRQQKRVLDRIRSLMPVKEDETQSIDPELKMRLRALMNSTQEKNLHILEMLRERKKNVLNKIVEVQNRRHVFDYLR